MVILKTGHGSISTNTYIITVVAYSLLRYSISQICTNLHYKVLIQSQCKQRYTNCRVALRRFSLVAYGKTPLLITPTVVVPLSNRGAITQAAIVHVERLTAMNSH